MTYGVIITILICLALLPWTLYFITYSKLKLVHIKAFLIGGMGWIIALILRTPILISASIVFSKVFQVVIASLLAGVFEEGLRFYFINKFMREDFSAGRIISMGIGWGLFEAILTYVISMISVLVIILYQIEVPDFEIPSQKELLMGGLIGAYERNVAIAIHVGFTIIVTASLMNRKWLGFAIIYHSLIDFIAAYLGLILPHTYQNLWIIEGIVTGLTILLYMIIALILKVRLAKAFTNSVIPSIFYRE